jgi:hypothetical protein
MTRTEYTAAARPFGRQRGPRIAATVLALFIFVAIVKPWPDGSAGRHSFDPDRSPSASLSGSAATPRPAAPSNGPNTMACLAGDQPQVVTVERASGREVRSWIAVADEQQPLPAGLRQVPISIYSDHIVGLGVCGPDREAAATPLATPPAGSAAEPEPTPRRDPQAATFVALALSDEIGAAGVYTDVVLGPPLSGQTSGIDSARLYGPPPTPRQSTAEVRSSSSTSAGVPHRDDAAAWPTGRWAIGFRYAGDAPSLVRWAVVDILPVGGDRG